MAIHAATARPCKETRDVLQVYPYPRQDSDVPWAVVVCPNCRANEILPIPGMKSTPIPLRFTHQMWQRFHGYERVLRPAERDKGERDPIMEFVNPTWPEHLCLDPLPLNAITSTVDGKSCEEFFTVAETPEA